MRKKLEYVYKHPQGIVFPAACRLQDLDNLTIQDLGCVFSRILWIVGIGLPGAAVVIFLIIGGIRYMASGGDEKAIAAARRSLMAAVLGFILIIGAATILWIIGKLIGNTDIIQFNIPEPAP